MSLADYSEWILAVAGLTTTYFVFVATFLEYGHHWRFGLKSVRFRFFRWWRHELTAAQVILDLCLTIVLLPTSLYILFGINLLSLSSNTTESMWYYAAGFTLVVGATIWRADATMRAKTRERRHLNGEGQAAGKRRAPARRSAGE